MVAETKTEQTKSIATMGTFVSINVTKNKRDFLFLMPAGTSFQECHEALVEGTYKIKELKELAEEAIKKQKEKAAEEKVETDESDKVEDNAEAK